MSAAKILRGFWGLKWLRHLPIRRRLVLVFGFGLAGILAISALIWIRSTQYHIQREFDDHIHIAQVIAFHVDDHLEHHAHGLRQTAAALNLGDADRDAEIRALQQLYAEGQYSDGVFLLDRKGTVLLTEPYRADLDGGNLAVSLPIISQVLDEDVLKISNLTPWREDTPASILFLAPVFNRDGLVTGVLGGALDPRSPAFMAAISLLPLPVEGNVELIDQNGIIISDSTMERVFEPTEHYPALQNLAESSDTGSAVVTNVEHGKQQEKQVVVYASLQNAPWGVEIALPYANVFAPARVLQNSLGFILILIAVFVMSVIGVVYLTIVQPIQELRLLAGQLAEGELDTYIPTGGGDEISALARALESMRVELVGWGRTLEAQVAARTCQLAALHRMGKRMNASLTLDALLPVIKEEIYRLFSVDAFFIALVDAENSIIAYCQCFDRGIKFPDEKHTLGKGITAWVITNNSSLLVRDFQEEEENLPVPLVWGSGEPPRSGMVIPLYHHQATIGVISLQSYQPNTYSNEDLDFLMVLTEDIAAAIETTRLAELSARRARQLALVNEIGRDMTQLVSSQMLLNNTAQQIVDKLGYNAAMIYTFVDDSLTLVAEYSQIQGESFGMPVIPLGEGIIGHVGQSKQPLLVPDVNVEDRFITYDSPETVNAELAVPVFANDHLAGVIDVCNREVGSLDKIDQQLLEAVAGQLAKTLANGHLYNQVQQQAQRALALNKIISVASSVLAADDLPELLEIALDQAVDLMDARIGAIWVPPHKAIRGISAEDYRPAEPLFTQLFRERSHDKLNTVNVEDWEDSSQHKDPVLEEVMKSLKVRTSIMIPLVVRGEKIGGISVGSRQLRRWLPEEIALLETIAHQIGLVVERTHLLDETRQKSQQLQVLNNLDKIIASGLDLKTTYTAFIDEAEHLLSFDRASVVLFDDARNTMRDVAVWTRHDPVLKEGMVLPYKGKALELLVSTQKPIIENELGEKRDSPANALLEEEGIRSQLLLPLIVKRSVIGMLAFGSCQAGAYSQANLEILQPLADQLAIAIEKTRLYEGLMLRLNELSAISEVSTGLRGAQSLEDMLPVVLEKTCGIMGADGGVIFMVDTLIGQFSLVAAHGIAAGHVLDQKFPLSGSIVEASLQTGEIDFSPDLTADIRFPAEMRAGLPKPTTGVGVPLQAGEAPVGVIGIVWKGEHTLNEGEIQIISAIADMAANAFHRVILFDRLQARVHELSQVYQLGQEITSSLRLDEVLNFAIQAAVDGTQAESASLYLWDEGEQCLKLHASNIQADVQLTRSYRLGEGMTGWVFVEETPVNIPDLRNDPRWKRDADQESQLPAGKAKNCLGVPLKTAAGAIGVLGVVNKIGGSSFSQNDLSLLLSLAGQVAVAIENARLYEDVRMLSMASIRSLATAIDARDPYTHGHSVGVATMAVSLARRMGWAEIDLEMLEFAGLLHDAGKIAIPDAVLRKPGKLNAEEWALMRMHPFHSAQIVKPIVPLARIVPWIYHHHERWDGRGYPDGIAGEKIPLASRILSLADTLNAMTTDRPYHNALNLEEAIQEIRRCSGSQFDPQAAKIFVAMLKEQGAAGD